MILVKYFKGHIKIVHLRRKQPYMIRFTVEYIKVLKQHLMMFTLKPEDWVHVVIFVDPI